MSEKILIFLIIALAIVYIARRCIKAFKGVEKCGGCSCLSCNNIPDSCADDRNQERTCGN